MPIQNAMYPQRTTLTGFIGKEGPFSLAQAFTPGFEESHTRSSPLSRGFPNGLSQSPLKGAETNDSILSFPGVNAWATENERS
jgi:hypothetical protein